MEEPTVSSTEQESSPPISRSSRSRLPLILALTAALGGLLLVCVFAGLIFCQTNECNVPTIGGNSEPTPTAFPPSSEPVVLPTPNGGLIRVGTEEDAIELPLDPPVALQVAEQNYAVQVGVSGGVWTPVVASESVAVWLNGTIINYVVALQDTENNRVLMQSLELGDEIVMTTEQGRALRFDFSSREQLPVTRPDIFAQTMPGVTVVLARNDDAPDRMVVRGRYVVEEAAQSILPGGEGAIDGGNVGTLGEVVQLGDLQLAVTAFDSRPQQGGTFDYFLVDYQIQNNGAAPLDAGNLDFKLQDAVGNQYVLNLDASTLGNQPPLPQSLGVAQPVQATAGYQITSGLDPNSLSWVVTRRDTGEEVIIRTSAASAEEAVPVEANITLDNAGLTQGGTAVLVQGQVTNIGAQTLVINDTDVNFASGGGTIFIQSSNPGFPWIIPPGTTIPYALTVQRPIGDAPGVFSILDFSWELAGFR